MATLKLTLEDFGKRLLSRKFLLTVAGAVYFYLQGDLDNVRNVIMGFLAAEGLADAAERYSN